MSLSDKTKYNRKEGYHYITPLYSTNILHSKTFPTIDAALIVLEEWGLSHRTHNIYHIDNLPA